MLDLLKNLMSRRKHAKRSTLALLALLVAVSGTLYPTGRVNAAACILQGNTITVSCDFTPGTYYYNGTFRVNAGVTVTAGNASTPGQVVIIADDFEIAGAINANGLGSAGAAGSCPGASGASGGGGCHAGYGGRGSGNVAGGAGVYGSATEPAALGSGGGDDTNTGGTQSGAGGGAIRLSTWSATGSLMFASTGSVTANGANSSSIEAGGGAGGSVWIDVGILDVQNGSVTANGGNGTGSGTNGGGGGSGGRVAIHYASGSGTPAQTRSAFGGNRGTTTGLQAQVGAPGTLFVWDKDEYGGDLTIDANNAQDTPLTAQTAGDDLVIQDFSIIRNAQYLLGAGDELTMAPGATLASYSSARLQSRFWIQGTFNAPSEAMTISGLDIHQNGTIGVLKYLTFDNGLYGIEPSSALFSAGPGAGLGSLVLSGTGTTTYSATGTGALFVGLFQAKSNVTLTHATNTTAHAHSLVISATTSVDIQSGALVSLASRGFSGGACNATGSGTAGGARQSGGAHGGDGGQGGATTSTTSTAYGSITAPNTIGSGGGGSSSCGSGVGGGGAGTVTLSASGTVTLDGTVTASGNNGSGTGGGGGAGGSVWIEAPTIAGTGTINVRGGNGSGSTGTNAAGGGGGGRVSVVYASGNPSSWTTTAYGGATSGSSGYAGGAGTIFYDDTDDAQPNGTLILDNNNQSGADSGQTTSSAVQFDAVTFRNGGKFGVRSGKSLKLPTGGAVTVGGSARPGITVYDGGELDANTASWDVEGLDVENSGNLKGPTSLSFKGSCLILRGAGRFHAAVQALQFRPASCFTQESSDPNLDLTSLDIPSGSTFNRVAGAVAPFGSNFQNLNIYGTYIDSSGIPLQVDTFTVQSGGLVTHATNTHTTVSHQQLIISATSSITVYAGGTITAAGRGFQGTCSAGNGPGAGANGGPGGSHGGNGAAGGGSTYDSVTGPTMVGSSGSGHNGFCSNGFGGNGGGAIKLSAGGTVLIAGTVNANATNGESYSGGGSGGSIWIAAGTLTGGGSITANGGTGGFSGGGGGGGRIALTYATDSGTGTRSAYSAFGSTGTGGAGTIFLDDTDDAQPNGTLVINNNNQSGAATTQASPSSQTYDVVDVRNGGNYTVANGQTLTLSSGGTLIGGGSTRGTLTVNSGGTFNTGNATFTFNQANVSNAGTISTVTNLTVEGSSTTLSGAGTFSSTLTGLTLRSSTFTQGSSNPGMNVSSLTMYASTYNNNSTNPGLNLPSMSLDSRSTFNNNSTAYYPLGTGFGDLTVYGNFTQNATTRLFVDDLTVQSGGLVMHATNTSTSVQDKGLDISATSSISILTGGAVNVASRGFAGTCAAGQGPGGVGTSGRGGGHGGNGGTDNVGTAGGVTYGSATSPATVGSSGSSFNGFCANGTGGSGGGAARLATSGTMLVAGTLTAAAGNGSGYGAGGSGGSIMIQASTLTGGGAISANGGECGGGVCGGGAGGRIAVYYATDSSTGTRTVYGGGGAFGGGRGGAGTMFTDDTDDALPNGTLIINNNNNAGGTTTQTGGTTQTYDVIDFRSGGQYLIPSGNTLALSSGGSFVTAGSTRPTVTVSSGATLDLNDSLLDLQGINITNAGTMPDVTTMRYGAGTFTHSGTFSAGLTSLTVGSGGNFTHATSAQLFTGSDLTIESGGTFTQSSSSTLDIDTVTVESGGTLTSCDNSTTHACGVNISATTFTVEPGAIVTTDAKGFDSTTGDGQGGDNAAGGGAGYGGAGGQGVVSSVASGSAGGTYGSSTAPDRLGSGGGDDTNAGGQQGGAGGGSIILSVTGVFTMNGDISADGQNGTANEGGGGSGGSVWLTLSSWTGSGTSTISANGGAGAGNNTTGGGCGGGGRIYITYSSKTYTGGTPTVTAGTGCTGLRAAQDGTSSEAAVSPTINGILHAPASPTVSDNVTVSASATYATGLDKIELYLDGTTAAHLRHTCDFTSATSGSCSALVGLLSRGNHTTTVKAYGDDLSVTTDSETFYVDGSTTVNSTGLSRLKVGVLATFTLTYTLSGTSTQDLVVTFPGDFTVQSAFTSGSGCLSNFGFTSTTLTADTTDCTGTVTATGAVVENPASPGAYTITWVDDEGEAIVAIVDDDQVNVTAAVNASITFDLDTSQTDSETSAPYTVPLGTVSTADGRVSGATDGVNFIWTDISTNASAGAVISVRSANGASGLVSVAAPGDSIPSATAAMSNGTANYGICVVSMSETLGTLAASSPFNGSCAADSETNSVGGLTTLFQDILHTSGAPLSGGRAQIAVAAAVSASTPAHNDYTDTLTFIATGTY